MSYEILPQYKVHEVIAELEGEKHIHLDSRLTDEQREIINSNCDITLFFGDHGVYDQDFQAVERLIESIDDSKNTIIVIEGFGAPASEVEALWGYADGDNEFRGVIKRKADELREKSVHEALVIDSSAYNAFHYATDLALSKGIRILRADSDKYIHRAFIEYAYVSGNHEANVHEPSYLDKDWLFDYTALDAAHSILQNKILRPKVGFNLDNGDVRYVKNMDEYHNLREHRAVNSTKNMAFYLAQNLNDHERGRIILMYGTTHSSSIQAKMDKMGLDYEVSNLSHPANGTFNILDKNKGDAIFYQHALVYIMDQIAFEDVAKSKTSYLGRIKESSANCKMMMLNSFDLSDCQEIYEQFRVAIKSEAMSVDSDQQQTIIDQKGPEIMRGILRQIFAARGYSDNEINAALSID
jgi:hypothetical protein